MRQCLGQSWGQSLANTLAIFIIAFVAGGCVSTLRVPQQAGGPRDNVAVPEPEAAVELSSGVRVVSIAESFIGTPYRYGGDNPKGFDCSGLVFYSFEQLGVKVPRTAADQRRAAERVTRSSLEPGDLVFFRSSKGRVDHVGIYAGDGRFIHAPSSGHVVSYGYLDDPYYRTHFVSAGRLPFS
jgi:cell wall-associated NlpC family hydrolase